MTTIPPSDDPATELATTQRNLDYWFNRAKSLEDQLADEMQISLAAANARVHRMADRKPWKLVALTAVAAFVAGAVVF